MGGSIGPSRTAPRLRRTNVLPMSDVLSLPLDDWDDRRLRELIGRHESQRLELKGPIDPANASHRTDVADEAAGMASTVGGFIIIGSNDADELLELPGIEATEEDAERLRNSLLDLVKPYVLLRGPKLLTADDPARAILVIEVLPHPLGLPASVKGVFRMRVEDSCRPMPYDEVRRRFTGIGDSTAASRLLAEAALDEVRERLQIGHAFTPSFGAAVVPVPSPRDLSLSGRELRDVFQSVVESEKAAWLAIEHPYWGPAEDLLHITATGVRSEVSHFWSWFLAHDASFSAAIDIIGPRTTGGIELGEVWFFWLSAVAARVVAFGAALQNRLGIAGSSHVMIESGPISGLMFDAGSNMRKTRPMQEPSTRVHYEFAIPIRSGTAQAVATEVELFCQRVHDGTGQGLDTPLAADVNEYLRRMLPD